MKNNISENKNNRILLYVGIAALLASEVALYIIPYISALFALCAFILLSILVFKKSSYEKVNICPIIGKASIILSLISTLYITGVAIARIITFKVFIGMPNRLFWELGVYSVPFVVFWIIALLTLKKTFGQKTE